MDLVMAPLVADDEASEKPRVPRNAASVRLGNPPVRLALQQRVSSKVLSDSSTDGKLPKRNDKEEFCRNEAMRPVKRKLTRRRTYLFNYNMKKRIEWQVEPS
jgi:hypothetical protein